MLYAVFADIHGNLEALQAALEYTRQHHLSRYLVLGDSIGYGADPNPCFKWAAHHAECHVLGNHEAAVLHDSIRESFSDWARIAIDWTAERMDPENILKMKELPYIRIHEEMSLAHGTIHAPERFDYLFDLSDARRSFRDMKTMIGLAGHSHVPCYFSEKEEKGGHLKAGLLKLKIGERYLLNPGSIGQPRDGDPRLSFGILDVGELTFEIVRLSYDNKKAAQKIRAEGLPVLLADRLL